MIKKIMLLTLSMLPVSGISANFMAHKAKSFFKPVPSLVNLAKTQKNSFATYTKINYYKNINTGYYLMSTYPGIITSLFASLITSAGIYLVEKDLNKAKACQDLA